MSTLTVLRTDTVFAKLPIHTLTKAVPIDICIHQNPTQGVQELHWKVSPSVAYGAPQLLAYKLDTLVVNRQLDALARPLPSLICLGSLRQICQDLGQSREASTGNLKRAFHQNAGVYITAKLHYRDVAGKQRRLEAGFHRYGVVFTGESLPDGSTADAVYLILHESYRQVLNCAPTRPVDYDYLMDLKPLAQRFYELLSFKMYAALKYQRAQVAMPYSELCQFAPQHRHHNGSLMSKQMYRVHLPHLESGYLAAVETERILDAQGEMDWLLHYTPGPRAQAEYQAFAVQHRQGRASLQSQGSMHEPPQAPCAPSEAVWTERIETQSRTQRPRAAHRQGGQSQQAKASACQPEAAVRTPSGHASYEHTPAEQNAAHDLVQQFYRELHGVSDKIPHPKEMAHARALLRQHGSGFATFFLSYAKQAVRQEGRTVHVFGGIMRYESSALAAYRRQEAREATQQAEATSEQQRRRLDAYEMWLRHELEALKETLPPAQLQVLRTQAEQRLGAAEKIPPYALACRVAHEIDTQLIRTHRLPSFEVWSKQHEKQHEALVQLDAQKMTSIS